MIDRVLSILSVACLTFVCLYSRSPWPVRFQVWGEPRSHTAGNKHTGMAGRVWVNVFTSTLVRRQEIPMHVLNYCSGIASATNPLYFAAGQRAFTL